MVCSPTHLTQVVGWCGSIPHTGTLHNPPPQPKKVGTAMTHLDDFLRGYVQTMLWVNAEDADGEPIDAVYAYQGPGRWWEDTPVDLADATAFYESEYATLSYLTEFPRAVTWEQHGHDFALTRNGHGAGFWDRGYGHMGDHLTDAARIYGEDTIYLDWSE